MVLLRPSPSTHVKVIPRRQEGFSPTGAKEIPRLSNRAVIFRSPLHRRSQYDALVRSTSDPSHVQKFPSLGSNLFRSRLHQRAIQDIRGEQLCARKAF